MIDMVEVVIDSIRVSLMSSQRVVILRQRDAERYLPIWVGPYEAEAITVALQEVEMSRPLTHDLLKNLVTLFDGKILQAEVVSLKEDIFFGNLVVQKEGGILNVDSRPSDAIAMAVRAHAPILVNISVMETAGIEPEKDMQTDAPLPLTDELPSVQPPTPEEEKKNEERLDVFEDFLKKLGDEPGEEKPND